MTYLLRTSLSRLSSDRKRVSSRREEAKGTTKKTGKKHTFVRIYIRGTWKTIPWQSAALIGQHPQKSPGP